MKMFSITAAVVAVAFFVGSVFAGKDTSSPPYGACQHLLVDGIINLLFVRVEFYDPREEHLMNKLIYRSIVPESGAWGEKYLRYEGSKLRLYDKLAYIRVLEGPWRMQFADEEYRGGVCILDNWNRAYAGLEIPSNAWNDAHWAILSGTNAAANCIPFPGTIDGEKIPVTSPVVYGVGDCAQAVSMQYPNATGVQVDPWGGPWTTKCYAAFGDKQTDEPNDNNAHRACFFRDTIRPGGLHGGVSLGTDYDNIEACVKAAEADVRALKAEAVGVTYDRATNECWYHKLSKTKYFYYSHASQITIIFSNPMSCQTKRTRRTK